MLHDTGEIDIPWLMDCNVVCYITPEVGKCCMAYGLLGKL